MNKAISFSLWGDNPMYCVGAIKNLELSNKIYSDWTFIIHYDNTVPTQYIKKLKNFNCILIDESENNINSYFWRFLSYSNYDVIIFRDCDSRISIREESAVNEWINSGKRLHIMRDHPAHIIPYPCNKPGILAGMWGILNKPDFDLNVEIINFHKNKIYLPYGHDQIFLMTIYDKFNNDQFVHDEFYSGNKFPIERDNYHFVGERFDENNLRGNDYIRLMK